MIMLSRMYEKIYLRENSLVALQMWDEHQTIPIKELWGKGYPSFIWDVTDGVASVYAELSTFDWVQDVCAEKAKDPNFIPSWLKRHEEDISILEKHWQVKQPLANHKALIEFCEQVIRGWVSLEVTYFAPMLSEERLAQVDRVACLALRERAIAFLDDSDAVILSALCMLYPEISSYVQYISLDELRLQNIPSIQELEKRAKHYIFHQGKVHTLITLEAFLKMQKITLKQEKPERDDRLTGQVAMTGNAAGRAYVLLKKSEVDQVEEGDILVSGMTIPDYLPAMKRAAAFVTDEGGVTCHAAIIAREFGKPCIIGTKFATELIKTGDWIEVDADGGIVRIIR